MKFLSINLNVSTFKTILPAALGVLAAQMIATTAFAVAPYSPPSNVQAQNTVEKQLANNDLKTTTRPLADASACGIQGPATIVEVQLPLARKVTAADGSTTIVKEFVTVKSYVVGTGYRPTPVDAETCLK